VPWLRVLLQEALAEPVVAEAPAEVLRLLLPPLLLHAAEVLQPVLLRLQPRVLLL
jgi:hypothetical protein